MATVQHGGTLPDTASKADFYNLIDNATVTGIVNADITDNTIANAKLVAITTASKVSGTALTELASIPSGAGVIPTANKGTGSGITGTADSDSTGKLIDSSATFVTNDVLVGATVLNTTDSTSGTIVSVDSETQLTLSSDLFPDGNENYSIIGSKFLSDAGTFAQPNVQAQTGMVVQVVNTTTSAYTNGTGNVPDDDTVPTWAEVGNISALQCKITPKSATNKLKITVCLQLCGAESSNAIAALFKDGSGTDAAISLGWHTLDTGYFTTLTFVHYRPAGDTSEQAYDIGLGRLGASGTVYLNGSNSASKLGTALESSITIEEIKV